MMYWYFTISMHFCVLHFKTPAKTILFCSLKIALDNSFVTLNLDLGSAPVVRATETPRAPAPHTQRQSMSGVDLFPPRLRPGEGLWLSGMWQMNI